MFSYEQPFYKVLVEAGVTTGQFPRMLYKYYTLNENTINALKNNYVYFSNRQQVNDSAEYSFISRGGTQEDLDRYFEGMSESTGLSLDFIKSNAQKNAFISNPQDFKKFNEEITDRKLDEFGFFCTTNDPLNAAMWGNYAANGRGIVVEYDVLESLSTFTMLLPVTYSDNIVELDLFAFNEGKIDPKIFHTKKSIWTYENEIRILKTNHKGPYPINPKAIKSIILGNKFPESDEEKLFKDLISWNYNPKIERLTISGTSRSYSRTTIRNSLYP